MAILGSLPCLDRAPAAETRSFNPKPEAMVRSGMGRPYVAPAIAYGLGLNEDVLL